MKKVKNCQDQWDGYIDSISFSNQALFCCKPSNLDEICGNTGNAEIFFYQDIYIKEAVISGNSASLFDSSFWAITCLEMFSPVRLLEWLLWIQLGLSRGPWDHGAANGSPGNHSTVPSTKCSPLVFDFQANYLSTAGGKSTHQNQFNFLNCYHLSLQDHITAIHSSFTLKSFSSKKGR